jgi:RNA polymerase-interacting CarD/CdnL/TRCF family regulator
MAFDLGDPVYCPGEGVGDVRAILETPDGPVFVIQLRKRNAELRGTEDQLTGRGLRHLIPLHAVDFVLNALRGPDGYAPWDTASWAAQVHCLQTGDPIALACVVRDLAPHSRKLPAAERKAYELARSLLVQEIAASRDVDEAVVEREIDAILR